MLDTTENSNIDRRFLFQHLLKVHLIRDAKCLVMSVVNGFFELTHCELLMDELNLFEQYRETDEG